MTVTDTAAGAAVYSPFFLRWIYDAWVLNISNSVRAPQSWDP